MCGEDSLIVRDYLGMNINDKATIVGRNDTEIVVCFFVGKCIANVAHQWYYVLVEVCI